MHVLIFIYSLSPGGAERVTANLANYWAGKPWPVTVVTLAGTERDFYTLDARIERVALGLDSDSGNLLSAVTNNLSRLAALRRLLKNVRPDVAIGMMSSANCLLALAALGMKIPVIGSERIHPPVMPIGPMWERLRRWAYPRLDAVVAQTAKSANWLEVETGAKQVVVIGNPVVYPPLQTVPVVQPDSVKSRNITHTLLAVGRLDPQKGLDLLIKSFSVLAPSFPQWQLNIVGDGDSRGYLEKQIEQLGLSGRINMPGVVGNMKDWYEDADVYVMTSRYEGFPNTLIEAMACGLPVVSVDCETGPGEIITNEIDGILVPQNDSEKLEQTLRRLMTNEELRQRLSSRAIGIRKRLSLERVSAQWEELMTGLVKHHG